MKVTARFNWNEVTFIRVVKSLYNRVLNGVNYYRSLFISLPSIPRTNNRTCVLLANGPSLANLNIEDLRDKDIYGMNRIYLNSDISQKLKGIFLVNKLVAYQFKNDFIGLDIPKYIPTSLLGIFGTKDELFRYSRFNPLRGGFGSNSKNHINPGSTVTYFALQVLLEMGYSKVIIVGLDHNFGSQKRVNFSEVVIQDKHHFDPNYFPKGSRWDTPDILGNEYWYGVARGEYEKRDSEIVDCTINGKCTIFKKSTLNKEL